MTKLPPPPEKISDPKISIVVPMYNVEKYVEACLNSVMNQTFRDFEVIVIDDCSTDRSAEIVKEKFGNISQIQLVCRGKNHGNGSALNFGIDLSRGEYIYFMDSDDMIIPETLKILIEAAEKSKSEVVYMNQFFRPTDPDFDKKTKFSLEVHAGNNKNPRFMSDNIIERIRNEIEYIGVVVPPWNKIQRRDFLVKNKIYFPETLRLEDWLFNFAEVAFGNKIQVIDACCYFYRSNPTSKMKEIYEKQLRNAVLSMKPSLEYIEEVFSRLPNKLPIDFQVEMQTRVLGELIVAFIVKAYKNGVPLDTIDKILRELPISMTTRTLIHIFGTKIPIIGGV